MENISSLKNIISKKLNIVFWGEDAFSSIVLESLVEAGHQVSLVISPLYSNLIYKKLEYKCSKYNIEFLRYKNINSVEVVEKVKSLNPDLCVVSHFEKLIKLDLLRIPRIGFINLHPSLLPDYRGMTPQHWPIINGEKEAGITVHYIDEGVDTGDIILQRRFQLTNDMYVSDLQKKWMAEYKTVMVEAIDNIINNRPVTIQRNLEGRYYGRLKLEDCLIDEEDTVQHAYNMVRGLSLPYHGAQYKNIIIYKAHIDSHHIEGRNEIEFKDGILVLDKFKNE